MSSFFNAVLKTIEMNIFISTKQKLRFFFFFWNDDFQNTQEIEFYIMRF